MFRRTPSVIVSGRSRQANSEPARHASTAEQANKQNNQTDVNTDERSAEIEEASVGLEGSVLAQKATKFSKWQIDGIREYRRVGLTLRETAKQLRLPPSTIYPYFKAAPGPVVIEKDSPGPSKLGQASVVPLDNNGKERGTSVVVTQDVTELNRRMGHSRLRQLQARTMVALK